MSMSFRVYIWVVVCLILANFSFGADEIITNDVVLPETKFFVEGAISPVMEKRDVILPSKEDKKDLYDIPSIRSFDVLEKEVKKGLSEDIRSRIISLFSYGLGDILNFSLIGLSQIPVDSVSVGTVIKYNRFKRPDVRLYFPEESILNNTFRDVDIANVSIGVSSYYVFWNTVFEFNEENRGLWKNLSYLDERNRNVVLDSSFRYKVDKDSIFSSRLKIDHFVSRLRSVGFNQYYTSVNDLFLGLGYRYGVDEFNFFAIDLGIGGNFSKLTFDEEYVSGVYGDLSFSFMFPIYGNKWFFGVNAGIIPNSSFPMEWVSRLSIGYKVEDTLFVFLSIFKEFDKFDSSYFSRGLNVLDKLIEGDSYFGVELNPKLFFFGNNLLNIFVGGTYYLSKVYDRYVSGAYVYDITNVVGIYSKITIDFISVDWFNLGGSYRFLLFIPELPYVSLHSVELSSKFIFSWFSFSFGMVGESEKIDNINGEKLYPYLNVYLEVEAEIIKNFSLLFKVDNVLNNLIEIRKDSIVSESFYVLGGVKVKL